MVTSVSRGPTRELERVAQALGRGALRDMPLGGLTTYRVGGPAALLVKVESEEDLLFVRRALRGCLLPILVLGKGSNLLVADEGFAGLVVQLGNGLGDLVMTTDEGDLGRRTLVRAGSTLGLPVLARRTADAGLVGLEWAVGVPGSVGGGLRMNAGGHGSDVAATLVRYRWLDLAREAGGEDASARLRLGYRRSSLSTTQVVLWGEFALCNGSREEANARISSIVRWRRANQPGGSNAGSVFANPPGDSAGRLVEEAGLKGLRHRSARVSVKHANFIVADAGGSANDVRDLMEQVRDLVERRTGVVLRTEIRLVGFTADAASEY